MYFIKSIFITLLLSATINSPTFSQELVFVNHTEGFEEGTEIRIQLQFDRKKAIEVITKNARINIGNYSFDSLVTLTINGPAIHEYINQYTPDQFRKLNTISLHQSRRIQEPTPRFFLNRNYNLDSVVKYDAGVLKYFLDESSMDSTFSLNIYHSRKLSKKDKQRIAVVKTAFCKEFGVDEKSIQLIDKNFPYSTLRFDFFNPGSIITDYFIENQNTPWMKAKAEEYSLVLVVEIVWKKGE